MTGIRRARLARHRFAAGSVCAALLLAGALPARAACERLDDKFWSAVEECRSAAAVKGYLKVYPEGCHVEKAKACLEGLRGPKWPTGKTIRECPVCPEMVVSPAGSFTMGSLPDEAGRSNRESPRYYVRISKPFAVGKYEVTRGEFAWFVGATKHSAGNRCETYEGGKWELRAGRNWQNPGFAQTDQDPVVCVNWQDAKAYVRWLSSRTGQRYRLLSEAEWEYAVRARTTMSRHWGDDVSAQCSYANGADLAVKEKYSGWKWSVASCRDGRVHTSPVGSYRSNGFGLHDMLGNVWEWVEDCWRNNYRGAPPDGRAWAAGRNCPYRARRGGSWINSPAYLRAATRSWSSAGNRNNYGGFRVARTLTP